jgi:hypothetical protein
VVEDVENIEYRKIQILQMCLLLWQFFPRGEIPGRRGGPYPTSHSTHGEYFDGLSAFSSKELLDNVTLNGLGNGSPHECYGSTMTIDQQGCQVSL